MREKISPEFGTELYDQLINNYILISTFYILRAFNIDFTVFIQSKSKTVLLIGIADTYFGLIRAIFLKTPDFFG